MVIQIFCQFFNWFVCFFVLVKSYEFFIYFGFLHFMKYVMSKYLLSYPAVQAIIAAVPNTPYPSQEAQPQELPGIPPVHPPALLCPAAVRLCCLEVKGRISQLSQPPFSPNGESHVESSPKYSFLLAASLAHTELPHAPDLPTPSTQQYHYHYRADRGLPCPQ